MASNVSSKRKLCDHCNEFVSLRTYRQHVDLYFNKTSKKWVKCGYGSSTSGSDLDNDETERLMGDDDLDADQRIHIGNLPESAQQPPSYSQLRKHLLFLLLIISFT